MISFSSIHTATTTRLVIVVDIWWRGGCDNRQRSTIHEIPRIICDLVCDTTGIIITKTASIAKVTVAVRKRVIVPTTTAFDVTRLVAVLVRMEIGIPGLLFSVQVVHKQAGSDSAQEGLIVARKVIRKRRLLLLLLCRHSCFVYYY